jgi:hypothetical protein
MRLEIKCGFKVGLKVVRLIKGHAVGKVGVDGCRKCDVLDR